MPQVCFSSVRRRSSLFFFFTNYELYDFRLKTHTHTTVLSSNERRIERINMQTPAQELLVALMHLYFVTILVRFVLTMPVSLWQQLWSAHCTRQICEMTQLSMLNLFCRDTSQQRKHKKTAKTKSQLSLNTLQRANHVSSSHKPINIWAHIHLNKQFIRI